MSPARVPPGRAGRLWLRRRTATARRGREQLDRRLRVLVPELQRRRQQVRRSRAEWLATCEEARTWLLRAALVGGQDVVRRAAPQAPAAVEVQWTTSVGVTFPTDVVLAASAPGPAVLTSSAVGRAGAAARAALVAGARLAADERAVGLVEREVALTRRRLRALEKRWLPWLTESLRALELTLEQSEQEDAVRRRRALDQEALP